jgi:hypothetical protein
MTVVNALPELSNATKFSFKKVSDVENTGQLIFEKYQQNTLDKNKFTKEILDTRSTIIHKLQNFKFHLNVANEDDRVIKYRELLKQEKQAFIEQTKIVSQAEVENRILKNYHRESMANIKYELNKIFNKGKIDNRKRLAGKINQSDSVHINPAFGGDSDRINAKSQNSFMHNNSEFDIEENKDHFHSNIIGVNNLHNLTKIKIENSGMMGINISGTTGGDDDPNLKFNNNLRKFGK